MNFDILRQNILEKAIQGKLVPQLDSEPAVDQIGEAPENVPFAIPEKWKWITLSRLTSAISDGSHNPPPNSGCGVPVLSAKNIADNEIKFDSVNRWTTEEKWIVEDRKIHIEKGDVLLTIVGTIGRTAIVNTSDKFMLQRSVCVLKPLADLVSSQYLELALQSPQCFQWMMDRAAGTAQKGVYLKTIKAMPIPFPSPEEQRRIVAKVDALFEQIDLAEKAHKELSGPLSDRFRALVLEQAIQGKIVPQLNSEPAVEQIGDAPEDVPFAIPEKWAWRKIGDLSAKRKTVDPKDIDETIVELWSIPAYDEGSPQIVPAKTIGSSKKIVTQGDILLAKIVPHIKRVWIVKDRGNGLKKLASTEWLVFTSKDIDQEYLCLAMKSPYFNNNMLKTVSGMGSLKRANPKEIAKIFVPIPPLEEQRRIVARVEALLKEVDAIAR